MKKIYHVSVYDEACRECHTFMFRCRDLSGMSFGDVVGEIDYRDSDDYEWLRYSDDWGLGHWHVGETLRHSIAEEIWNDNYAMQPSFDVRAEGEE